MIGPAEAWQVACACARFLVAPVLQRVSWFDQPDADGAAEASPIRTSRPLCLSKAAGCRV